jgi:hypothetical protein
MTAYGGERRSGWGNVRARAPGDTRRASEREEERMSTSTHYVIERSLDGRLAVHLSDIDRPIAMFHTVASP